MRGRDEGATLLVDDGVVRAVVQDRGHQPRARLVPGVEHRVAAHDVGDVGTRRAECVAVHLGLPERLVPPRLDLERRDALGLVPVEEGLRAVPVIVSRVMVKVRAVEAQLQCTCPSEQG